MAEENSSVGVQLVQAQTLCKILENKDFSIITKNNIDERYFFSCKAEFNFIKNHVDMYGVVPDKETFVSNFPEFQYVECKEPDSFLLNELSKDFSMGYNIEKLNSVIKCIRDGNDKLVEEKVKDWAENMHPAVAVAGIDIMQDTSRYDHYVERTTNRGKYYLSTGFPELDHLISGIDRENENMVIAARTGVGKSWTLLKMAAAAYLQGLNVGIYSGEMSVDKVGYRIDTLISHINNASITHDDLSVQKEYKKYIENLPRNNQGKNNKFMVVTPAEISGPATVGALKSFIQNNNIEILFVDQYSLLEDTSKSRVMHERVANISKDIKNLQVLSKIPIVSVSQMNRTKNEDGSQDTTQIGLSDRIGQDATVILMLDRKEDRLTINIVKSRDGGDNKKLVYKADWNVGEFSYIPADGDGVTTEEDFDNISDRYDVKDFITVGSVNNFDTTGGLF